MVAIAPFAALRYNPERIQDLTQVIAPPYDVISAEEQERLYGVSPYNIVRLILGKQYPNDTAQENRYTRAARDFQAWCDNQVLRRDAAPALYLVEHRFNDGASTRARLGFIALLQFQEQMERAVLRHEATLAAPKQDRTKLLEAIPASLEPIFCVYPDGQGAIQHLLQGVADHTEATAEAMMQEDRLRIWAITETSILERIAQALASATVLIADGHHRFEVAFTQRARVGAVMTYFASMADPSLVVRPIHRIVQRAAPVDARALEALCVLTRMDDLDKTLHELQSDTEPGRFGYTDGRTLYHAKVKPETLARWRMAPSVPLPLALLDVSLLHGLLLPALGVQDGASVRYTAQAPEALQAAQRQPQTTAWWLRGIPLSQVYAIAAQGFTLPPKSTYFYPKVPSGLTINPLN